MNKILAFFPLNKGIQKGAGKKLLFGLLKYFTLWAGSALIMRILGRIPLVGNLIYHLGRILDIYCPIGMITAIIQLLAVVDDTEIEYIGAGKIKELLINKKVLIGVAIAAVALCIIPKSIWTGGSKNKSVDKKDEKVAEDAKQEDNSEDKKEEVKKEEQEKEEPGKEDKDATETEPAEEEVYEVPEELKSVQGYVDENGEIVYGEWPTDENCWWALRNYADVKTKLPVYAKTSNGDIRYDLTWDTTAGHWHLIKYYKDKIESDDLYDDAVEWPIRSLLATSDEDEERVVLPEKVPTLYIDGTPVRVGETTYDDICRLLEKYNFLPYRVQNEGYFYNNDIEYYRITIQFTYGGKNDDNKSDNRLSFKFLTTDVPDYDKCFMTREKSVDEFLKERDEKVASGNDYTTDITYVGTGDLPKDHGIDLSGFVLSEFDEITTYRLNAELGFEFGNTVAQLSDFYGDNPELDYSKEPTSKHIKTGMIKYIHKDQNDRVITVYYYLKNPWMPGEKSIKEKLEDGADFDQFQIYQVKIAYDYRYLAAR